jgi:hypothetical protein
MPENRGLRPYDPIVSLYPLPLSPERARDEAKRARRLGKKLPLGHPYRGLPLWLPYGLARLINRSASSSKPDPDDIS